MNAKRVPITVDASTEKLVASCTIHSIVIVQTTKRLCLLHVEWIAQVDDHEAKIWRERYAAGFSTYEIAAMFGAVQTEVHKTIAGVGRWSHLPSIVRVQGRKQLPSGDRKQLTAGKTWSWASTLVDDFDDPWEPVRNIRRNTQ